MKKIFLLMTIGSVGLLSSCAYDKIEPKPLPEAVSYSNDIQPIWNQSCIVCHSPGGEAESIDLSAGKSYNALISGGFVIQGDAAASTLFKVLDNGTMPGSRLPQAEIDLVKKWINDGALNN